MYPKSPIFRCKKIKRRKNWIIELIEKAIGNPTTEIFATFPSPKIFLTVSLNRLADPKKLIKKKDKPRLIATKNKVSKAGVFVSCKEKNALVKKGINDKAKIETAKKPKETVVSWLSSKLNLPTARISPTI